jgi:hypothetical protein
VDVVDAHIAQLRARNPYALRLAILSAFAVRLEPHLLRALRRVFVPHADPAAELDLWHSTLVASRGANAALLEVETLARLRIALSRDSQRDAAYRKTLECLEGYPPLHRFEVELNALPVLDPGVADEAIEGHFAPVLAALRLGGDPAQRVARWLLQAAPRWHPRVRDTAAAWAALLASSALLEGRRLITNDPPTNLRADELAQALPVSLSATRQVGVMLTSRHLRFLPTTLVGAAQVYVPAVSPALMVVEREDGSERRVISAEPGSETPTGGADTLILRSLTGEAWRVERPRRGRDRGRMEAPKPQRARDLEPGQVSAGIEIAHLEGHTGRVTALGLLPDGHLASGSADGTIRLWDLSSGAETSQLEGDSGGVTALWLLPDGRLASGSADGTIRLWDSSAGVETGRLVGHSAGVTALGLLPDGRLASGSADGTIRLWDLDAGGVQSADDLRRSIGDATQVQAKSLRVFVSSPYSDLREYREAVRLALARQGHRFSGPEQSAASDRPATDYSLSEIANCDVFVCIVAWRYGSVLPPETNPDSLSILEFEYLEASKLSKPVLVFLLDADASWPTEEKDAGTGANEKGERVRRFRERLRNENVISTFRTPEDLASQVLAALANLQDTTGQGAKAREEQPQAPLLEMQDQHRQAIEAALRAAASAGPERLRAALARFDKDPSAGVQVSASRGPAMVSVSEDGLPDFEADESLKSYETSNHIFADLFGGIRLRWPILFFLSEGNPQGAHIETMRNAVSIISLGRPYSLMEVTLAVDHALAQQNIRLTRAGFLRSLIRESGVDGAQLSTLRSLVELPAEVVQFLDDQRLRGSRTLLVHDEQQRHYLNLVSIAEAMGYAESEYAVLDSLASPVRSTPTESVKPLIYISYAHADEPEKPSEGEIQWLSFVMRFLRPAIGVAEFWIDRMIPGDSRWDAEIASKLEACDIFILLVSHHSLSSDHVNKEIASIRERQANGENVYFYPLLLTPTPEVAVDQLRDNNLRPRDGRPLSSFALNERNRHMSEAADEIAETAKETMERKSASASSRFRLLRGGRLDSELSIVPQDLAAQLDRAKLAAVLGTIAANLGSWRQLRGNSFAPVATTVILVGARESEEAASFDSFRGFRTLRLKAGLIPGVEQ